MTDSSEANPDASAGAGKDFGQATDEAARTQRVDPGLANHLLGLRQRSVIAIGEAVLVLGATRRYRDQTLEDLRALLLEPLVRDRVVIVRDRGQGGGPLPPVPSTGLAFWASVSDEVEERIRAQIGEGVFPIRLRPDDWVSGETAWLLDVIAPTRAFAGEVVRQFRKVARTPRIKLCPVVARVIEPELLAELTAAQAGTAKQAGDAPEGEE